MPHNIRAGGQCFRLRLLGRWQLVVDGEDVGLGHREERLTALLGLTGRSSRLHVAGILWPESTDTRALASLRRAVLQVQQRSPGLLRADRLTIGLAEDVEVDVADVRAAAAATEDDLADDAAELPARLAGEDLLPDWYDEWVLQQREDLERLRVRALERVARHAFDSGDLTLTVEAAHAAGDIDPLLEWAAELAIRAHRSRGDVGSARRTFDHHREALRSELDAPPSRSILDLVETLETAASPEPPGPPPPAPPLPVRRVPRPPVATAPIVSTPPVPTPPAVPRRPPERTRSAGVRGAAARLVAVAAVLLAAALVVAGVGHRGGVADVDDTGGAKRSPMRVLPAGSAVRAGQMVVRPVSAAVGRAAFLVRASLRPALVRFEVRGRSGAGVVRSLLVRSARGRVLELDGLEPGVYQWQASSPVASAVSGRLRIADPPEVRTAAAVTSDTVAETAAPASTGAGSTAPASPRPSQQPASSTPSGSAPATRSPDRPKDPGTAPPGPVG